MADSPRGAVPVASGTGQQPTGQTTDGTKSTPPKTKAQQKAERKAAFEAQRALEATKLTGGNVAAAGNKENDGKASQVANRAQQGKSQKTAVEPKQSISASIGTDNQHPAEVKEDTPKSKGQQRAERRALQEAQRALKANSKSPGVAGANEPVGKSNQAADKSLKGIVAAESSSGKNVPVPKKQPTIAAKKIDQPPTPGPKDSKIRVPASMQVDDEKVVRRQSKKLDRQNVPQRPSTGQKQISLFKHLAQHERNTHWTHESQRDKLVLHKAIRKLGLQYMEGTVCGSNARCIALMMAMKEVIADYKTPPNVELSRDLEFHIRPFINFLNVCRPLSVSMGNAIKYLKHQINHIGSNKTDAQAKQDLRSAIDSFVNERILLAGRAISDETCSSICNGDVILIYSCSSLVRNVLKDALSKGIKFTVIVADGRPLLEGRVMLRRLVSDGITCSYVLINAVSFVMHEVTKVILGAHALLANGCVMSRVGSSQISLIAKTYNIPVLVCCETYKFCERVQTDSFVFNELGDPNDLVSVNNGSLSGWRDVGPLHVLNLVYDVTPAELISTVVTELGSIPSTSVPVVLRVKYS